MTNFSFARGAALFVAPMIVASCGGGGEPVEQPPVEQGLVMNAPDAELAGCLAPNFSTSDLRFL